VHPGVFNHFRAMLADLGTGIKTQEVPVGPIEMGNKTLGIRYDTPVVDAVEDQLIHLKAPKHGLRFRSGTAVLFRHEATSRKTECIKCAICSLFTTLFHTSFFKGLQQQKDMPNVLTV
jgi:hypothetical protein